MRISDVTPRMLLGPGPSDVPARVLDAMARPTIGHLDPQYLEIMDEIQGMLRQVFGTENATTLVVSATGSGGMETAVVNLIEPADRMLVCIAGYFGNRLHQVAQRAGADVTTIEVPWGQVFDAAQVQQAIDRDGPFKVVAIVHAETSTGALQPLEEISTVVHKAGALFLVDAVTSLGGVPVKIDAWKIDACYSVSQKCLSAPPGLAPVTFSPAAIAAIQARRTPIQSYYFGLDVLVPYWSDTRSYHHTAPINLYYALHEALSMALEESMENRWQRHQSNHVTLRKGLEGLGLRYVADPDHILPVLNAVSAPEGVAEATVRRQLLDEYNIEIGGGLGAFAGKAWRIGLMGASSTQRHIDAILAALGEIL